MTNSCALARSRLVNEIEGLRKSSRVEKITSGIKAGYVGSIVTPMRAVAGNASMGGLTQLAQHPLAVAIDVVNSVGKSAATGFKTKPHTYRTLANSLNADGMGAFMTGFKRGTNPMRDAFAAANRADNKPVSTFINELRLRLNARPEIPNSSVEYKRVNYDHPLAQTMVDGAFSILEAADRPWWLAAFDTEIYRQSKLWGIHEGLTGKELKARTEQIMAKPTDEMILRAQDAANYATFKDRNILSNVATSAKMGIKRLAEKPIDEGLSKAGQAGQRSAQFAAKVGDVISEATVPFTGVPSSVAGKIASVSPFGILNPDIFKGGQAKRSLALANAGIGYGMVALGMKLFDEGKLTGSMPRNESERAQWNEAGKAPFSVLINGKWVGLKILGPAASSLFMGAAMRRAMDENPDDKGDAIGKGIGSSAEFLTQQTYLQQIGNLVETAKGGASVGRLAGSMIPAPALIGQVSRAADPYERDQKGFVQTVKAKAGLGFTNPRRMGPTGPLPAKSGGERFSQVASPFPIKQSRDTEVLKEIRRLKIPFGLPSQSLKINGKNVKLQRPQYEQFVKDVGPETLQVITGVLSDPEFQALPDDEKRDVLSDIVTSIRRQGREKQKAQLSR